MATKRRTIGFDRTLELDWLDATAAKVAAGASPPELREYMWDYLEGVVRGDTWNSGRGKTVTVLTHIWSRVPKGCEGLRDRALQLVDEVEPKERVALHWAMATATYPYFFDIATTVGQLLKLQGEVAVPHVTKRLGTRWGQRQLVERTAQHVTKTMGKWGALNAVGKVSMFTGGNVVSVGASTGLVLVEAVLLGSGSRTLESRRASEHPALFPFSFNLRAAEFRRASQFQLHREGGGEELVGLVG